MHNFFEEIKNKMMLNSIHIQNFRCFNNLKVKGFKDINLIGGSNNVGKTALLEALLLLSYPSPSSYNLLRQFRNEKDSLIKNATDKIWNYFFYNQNKTEVIKFSAEFAGNQKAILELSCTKDIESILEAISSNSLGNNGKEKISEIISTKFSDVLLLSIKGNTLRTEFNYFLLPDKEDGDIGAIGKAPQGFDLPPFLHTTFRLNDEKLTALYSQVKENRNLKILNDILHLIDNRIIGSEIDAPGGEPVIKLMLNDEQSLPVSMFGDAVRKVTELVLVMLNVSNAVLLIDEIENGIHYIKHKDLWTKLFQIVGKNNIQIFATSHSGEMIRAFNKVAHGTEFDNKAMYFEMARTEKSNRIVVNPMDMSMLNYEILTNNSYRGE